MNHVAYVTAAYAAAAIGISGLIIWVILGHRNAQRILAQLESEGVTRRSTGSGSTRTGSTGKVKSGQIKNG